MEYMSGTSGYASVSSTDYVRAAVWLTNQGEYRLLKGHDINNHKALCFIGTRPTGGVRFFVRKEICDDMGIEHEEQLITYRIRNLDEEKRQVELEKARKREKEKAEVAAKIASRKHNEYIESIDWGF
jgi:hypothetical protein